MQYLLISLIYIPRIMTTFHIHNIKYLESYTAKILVSDTKFNVLQCN